MTAYPSKQSYNIWVLRLWQESDTGDWRATVTQSPEGEQYSFSSKESLISFLDESLAQVTM